MKYKLIALDLDGTLNNDKKEITAITRDALMKAQERGAKVVLASGRPKPGLYKNAGTLELDRFGGYLLCFNGANISEYGSGKVIYNKEMSPNMAKMIYDYNKKQGYNLTLMSYEGNYVLAEDENAYMVKEEAFLNSMEVKQVDNLKDTFTHPVNKLLFSANAKFLEEIEMEFKKPYIGQLSMYRSAPFYLEVMPLGVDKAYSMERLVMSMGIERSEVIAFGDGYNDLSMIEYAGFGVAMGNAVEELKIKADRITKSNNEDGIALILEELMKKELI